MLKTIFNILLLMFWSVALSAAPDTGTFDDIISVTFPCKPKKFNVSSSQMFGCNNGKYVFLLMRNIDKKRITNLKELNEYYKDIIDETKKSKENILVSSSEFYYRDLKGIHLLMKKRKNTGSVKRPYVELKMILINNIIYELSVNHNNPGAGKDRTAIDRFFSSLSVDKKINSSNQITKVKNSDAYSEGVQAGRMTARIIFYILIGCVVLFLIMKLSKKRNKS